MRTISIRQDETILAVMGLLSLVFVVAMLCLLSGCATTQTGASGDNTTQTLSLSDLTPYITLAAKETATALALYEATKDETALAKINYWIQYANGIAQEIETLQAGK